MEKHPVECVMDTTLLHIKEMVDVDTVVGKPVFSENGTIIIPLSKLGIGFVAGGAEYGQKHAAGAALRRRRRSRYVGKPVRISGYQ